MGISAWSWLLPSPWNRQHRPGGPGAQAWLSLPEPEFANAPIASSAVAQEDTGRQPSLEVQSERPDVRFGPDLAAELRPLRATSGPPRPHLVRG